MTRRLLPSIYEGGVCLFAKQKHHVPTATVIANVLINKLKQPEAIYRLRAV